MQCRDHMCREKLFRLINMEKGCARCASSDSLQTIHARRVRRDANGISDTARRTCGV